MPNESVIKINNGKNGEHTSKITKLTVRKSQLPDWYCFKTKGKVTKRCESCIHLEMNKTCRNLTG